MMESVPVLRDRDGDGNGDDTNFLGMDDVEIKVEHEIHIGDFETETEIGVEHEEEVIVNFASTGELISARARGNEVPEDPLSLTSFDEHKSNTVSRKSKRVKETKPSKRMAKTKTVNVKRPRRTCTEKPKKTKYTSSGTYNYNCQKCSLNFRTEVELQTHVTTAHTTINVRNTSNSRTIVKATEPVVKSATVSIISFACAACSCKFSSKMGLDIHECTATPIPVHKKSNKKTKRTSVTPATVQPDHPLKIWNIPTLNPEIEIKIETEYENFENENLSPSPPSPPSSAWANDDGDDDKANDSESPKKSLRPSQKRKAKVTRSNNQESESGSEPEAPDPKRKRRRKSQGSRREINESNNEADDFLQEPFRKRNPKNIRNSTKKKTKTTNPRKSKRSTATKCSHCDKTFSNSEKRESHIKTDHPDIQPTILCEDCPLLFYHNSAYLTHKSEHSLPHPHACQYCDEKFITVRKLGEHRKTHREIAKKGAQTNKQIKQGIARKCPFEECGLVFYTRRSFRDHRCEVHGARRRPRKIKESTSLLCKECGKLFSTQEARFRHEKVHDVRRFPCPVSGCGKIFMYECKLKDHSATHLPDRPFKCDDCEKSFKLESSLKYHGKYVHEDRPKDHVCKFCNRGFKIKSKLTIHERSHTGERPFHCQVLNCGARFHSASGMSNHKRFVHGDENAKKSRYGARLKTRGGPNTFPCCHCGKMFRTKDILRCHEITIHPGQTDRPIPKYVCTYCRKIFLSQYSLDVHERIHTGEKPFACPRCSKDFRSKELLAIHVRSHMK